MATSEPVLLAGWVLHRRAYRNTSLILDCLSREWGRFSAVLKGGRQNPLAQPLRPLWLQPVGRGELFTLRQLESRAIALQLEGSALYCALYVNELLTRLLGRLDPHPDVFDLYQQVLTELEQPSQPLDVILRRFEFSLLTELGYGFSLEYDAEGQPLQAHQCYRYLQDQGLVASAEGVAGERVLGMAQELWNPQNRAAAKQLFREVLRCHLGDKPLSSRQLFQGRTQEN